MKKISDLEQAIEDIGRQRDQALEEAQNLLQAYNGAQVLVDYWYKQWKQELEAHKQTMIKCSEAMAK